MHIFFEEFETYEDRMKLKQTCLEIITYICDYKMTLREMEDNLMIPRATLDRYIHTMIKSNFPTEYRRISKILEWNKKYKFKPKKYWTICPY